MILIFETLIISLPGCPVAAGPESTKVFILQESLWQVDELGVVRKKVVAQINQG